jgi:hypothetical protein
MAALASAPSLSRSLSSVTNQQTEGTCLLHTISNMFVHNIAGIHDIVLPVKCNKLLNTYTFFYSDEEVQFSSIMGCMDSLGVADKEIYIKKILLHLHIYSLSKSICGGIVETVVGDTVERNVVNTDYLNHYQNLLVDIQYCIMNNIISKDFEGILFKFNSHKKPLINSTDKQVNIYNIFKELLTELQKKSNAINPLLFQN